MTLTFHSLFLICIQIRRMQIRWMQIRPMPTHRISFLHQMPIHPMWIWQMPSRWIPNHRMPSRWMPVSRMLIRRMSNRRLQIRRMLNRPMQTCWSLNRHMKICRMLIRRMPICRMSNRRMPSCWMPIRWMPIRRMLIRRKPIRIMPIRRKPIRIMPIHWKLFCRMPIRRIPIRRMSICQIRNRKWPSFLMLYLTMNELWYSVSIFYYYSYSLFRRIGPIPYLSRMQNEEKKKVCVQYLLIYNIDVTLGRRLRKLYVYVIPLSLMNIWSKRFSARIRNSLFPIPYLIEPCLFLNCPNKE